MQNISQAVRLLKQALEGGNPSLYIANIIIVQFDVLCIL